MKKQLSSLLALTICCCVSGCKGNTNDINKQLTKMETLFNKGDFFREDYEISGEIYTKINDNDANIEYSLEKDGDNYHVEIETEIGINEDDKQYWFIKNGDKYDVYFNNNGTKQYVSVGNVSIDTMLLGLFSSANIRLDPHLANTYANVKSNIENNLTLCNEGVEGYTCGVERKLILKVIFKSSYTNGSVTTSSLYELRRGKIDKISSSSSGSESYYRTEVEFEYKNQTVNIPNKNEYNK